MTDSKRTHQIGVRVTSDELRRIQLRAKLHTYPMRPASYLRYRALHDRPDPTPEILELLHKIVDLLEACRYTDLYTTSTVSAFNRANKLLRQIVQRIGY
ncbi:MAG: hypothetical protein AAF657_14000 [Acidobacteriota bacterium]